MIESKATDYDTAIGSVARIFPQLALQPLKVKQTAEEIRIKAGAPIIIRSGSENSVLQTNASQSQIEECIAAFCRNSVHAYEKDIASGFITLKGGHRAGICGTAVYSGGSIRNIKNISSVNIRIARQHTGTADGIVGLFEGQHASHGLLIAGKPLSGKTTVLRDLCRQLGGRYRISLIDERDEIAAVYDGVPTLDVGLMTDVFSGYQKDDGILRALRSMSPDYVFMDELGADSQRIIQLANCGVGLVMTAHADSIDKLCENRQIRLLCDCGAVEHIAFINNHRITAVASAEAVCRKYAECCV